MSIEPDPRFWLDAIGEGPCLMISNFAPEDQDFIGSFGEHGWVTWNVTRLWNDAVAGQHGTVHPVPVRELLAASSEVEVDRTKIDGLRAAMRAGKTLAPLLMLTVGRPSYMIDGHHRLHALAAEGIETHPAYIVGLERPFDVLHSRYRIIKRRFPDQAALDAFKRAHNAARTADPQ